MVHKAVISRAMKDDLPKILELQYLAFESEAKLFGSRNIPPLRQTIADLENEYSSGTLFLKMVLDGDIIGSVRVRTESEADTVSVGKLMVHPLHRCRGYGSLILKEAEKLFPCKRFELFTSTKSVNNIILYEKNGYRIFDRKNITAELEFVYMEKDMR